MDYFELVGLIGSVASILCLVFAFGLGMGTFDVRRYFRQRFGSNRIPKISGSLQIPAKPQRLEEVPISNVVTYFVSENAILKLSNFGRVKTHNVALLFCLGPGALFFVLTLASYFLDWFVVSSFFSLMAIGAILIGGWQSIPFSSFAHPTEFIFTESDCTIISPAPITESGENTIKIDRYQAQFSAGALNFSKRFSFLDWLALSVEWDEGYVNLVLLPRWYARYFSIPSFGDAAASLNSIAQNR